MHTQCCIILGHQHSCDRPSRLSLLVVRCDTAVAADGVCRIALTTIVHNVMVRVDHA